MQIANSSRKKPNFVFRKLEIKRLNDYRYKMGIIVFISGVSGVTQGPADSAQQGEAPFLGLPNCQKMWDIFVKT